MPSVAILGASNQHAKFGNKAVRAFRQAGWEVYPINPRERAVEGLPAFRSLKDLPGRVDVLSIYLPPGISETLVEEIIATEPRAIWLNPGAESPALLRALHSSGLPLSQHCSILALGLSPSQFPD